MNVKCFIVTYQIISINRNIEFPSLRDLNKRKTEENWKQILSSPPDVRPHRSYMLCKKHHSNITFFPLPYKDSVAFFVILVQYNYYKHLENIFASPQ